MFPLAAFIWLQITLCWGLRTKPLHMHMHTQIIKCHWKCLSIKVIYTTDRGALMPDVETAAVSKVSKAQPHVEVIAHVIGRTPPFLNLGEFLFR